jgi:DNA-binding MarR family transcriptional regulator
MSTAYSKSEPTSPDGAAAAGVVEARDIDAADPASAEALAVATSTFVGTFDHWSSRKAAEAGASLPRLHLLYQVHCHGPQKMADLADALAVTPRNVTALVDGLEAEGMVRRVPHTTDRRVTLVELTCNSERVAAQFGTYQASIASLFAEMTDDERRTLLRLLGSLHDRMHSDSATATGGQEPSDA